MRFDKLTRYEPSEDGMFLNNVSGEYVEYCEVKALFESLPAPTVQAPVQTAAEWVSVDERLPEVGQIVAVYSPPTIHDWPGSVNLQFDCIDENDDDASSWASHNSNYEHWCCVDKTEGATGPSEKAPYTHWSPLPPTPGQQVVQGEKGGDAKPLTRCAAGRYGECSHAQCPQLRDREPTTTGRHCPLDNHAED